MEKAYYIHNASIVNEGEIFTGNVYVREGIIQRIERSIKNGKASIPDDAIHIDATDKYLIPGIIDDQVHFREPGLIHKADLYTESKAAVAGGVTSFMEMPNTIPNTLTQDLLEEMGIKTHRKGDDLYCEDGKLTVSIATCSASSMKIHFAMNLTTTGTPKDIKTVGLIECSSELDIDEISKLTDKISETYMDEILDIEEDIAKIRVF